MICTFESHSSSMFSNSARVSTLAFSSLSSAESTSQVIYKKFFTKHKRKLQKRTARCFDRLINMSSISSVTSSISSLSTWWMSQSSTFSSFFKSPEKKQKKKTERNRTFLSFLQDACEIETSRAPRGAAHTFVNRRNAILKVNETGHWIDAVFFGLLRVADLDESNSLLSK